MKRRITAVATAAAATFLAFLPTNASAATHTKCPSGSLCLQLYHNSYWGGSSTAFTHSVSNFAGYTFLSSGAGQGETVKNNAASASLLDYPANHSNAAIFFSSGYSGACDFFYGHGEGSFTEAWRLGPTYNENASFYFTKGGPPSGSNCATWR